MELVYLGLGILIGWIAKEIHSNYMARKSEQSKVWGRR